MQSKDQKFYKERFAKLEVEQLEELIRQDCLADGSLLNTEQTLAILEIIEERRPSGVGEAEIDAAWDSFQAHYLPLVETNEALYDNKTSRTKATRRRFVLPRLSWVAAILAVFILSSSLFAYQVYGYNVWENIAKWTSEIFQLKTPVTPNGDAGEGMFPDAADPRLQPLYEAMKELEIPTTLAPTCIPERFEGPGIIETSHAPFKGVINGFILEQETLMLSFDYNTNADSMYEKDDSPVTSLRINGVTYYFMSNNAQNRVVWSVDQYECSINGTVTYEELEQMVLSIYER
ncbi:MAG TPA: hypothetical protein DDZ53_03380 [Firmicutes bacterium]|jgi:hypothetical protein|nr:hypothetical protein [Bacillota bacterium]